MRFESVATACLALSLMGAACAQSVTPQTFVSPSAVPTVTPTSTAIPSATHTRPRPSPTALATPTMTWATYSDPSYGIALQYPAGWKSDPAYDKKYTGADGFFQLSAISSPSGTIDEVAEGDALHKLMPYGSSPYIEALQVDGQEARLILPSADQPEAMKGHTGLIVLLPQPIHLSGYEYNYMVLWADIDHVRQIADTLQFEQPSVEHTPAPTAPSPPDTIQAMLFGLAMRFRVRLNEVQLVDWEQVDWPDGCLGIPMRRACTQAIVPGYRFTVVVGGEEYEYRSDLAGSLFLLAAGPAHGVEKPLLIWEGGEDCETLLLGGDGEAAAGPCGAPLTPGRLLEEMSRPEEWAQLMARFDGFDADTPSGRISFRGSGDEQAAAPWQRAIAAWAGLAQQEIRFGRSAASWGSALNWQREIDDRPGYCLALQVDIYGYVQASEILCEGGYAQTQAYGWLTDRELEALDGWLYTKSHASLPGLLFAGIGDTPMTESDVGRLRIWAQDLYARMTGDE